MPHSTGCSPLNPWYLSGGPPKFGPSRTNNTETIYQDDENNSKYDTIDESHTQDANNATNIHSDDVFSYIWQTNAQRTTALQPIAAPQRATAQPTAALQSTAALQPTAALQRTTALQPTAASPHSTISQYETLQNTSQSPATSLQISQGDYGLQLNHETSRVSVQDLMAQLRSEVEANTSFEQKVHQSMKECQKYPNSTKFE